MNRKSLQELFITKNIDINEYDRVVDSLNASKKEWGRFIDIALLFLGGGFFSVGLIFFFAYNWDNLHKFVKLAIPLLIVISSILVVLKFNLEHMIAKSASLVAIFGVGVEFALFGQIYQTGADAWNLFFAWSIFTIGFVFTIKCSISYLLWLIVTNSALFLFIIQNYYSFDLAFKALLVFNFFTMLFSYHFVENLKYKNFAWLKEILILAFLFLFTIIVFGYAVNKRYFVSFFISLIFYLPIIYLLFSYEKKNLFTISVVVLSLIFVSTAFIVNLIPNIVGKIYLGTIFFLIFSYMGVNFLLKRIHSAKN